MDDHARARILVADDDRAVLDAIACSLQREGYTVETVQDGEAALAPARRGDFDLAILNVMMPRLFGTDVCRTCAGGSLDRDAVGNLEVGDLRIDLLHQRGPVTSMSRTCAARSSAIRAGPSGF